MEGGFLDVARRSLLDNASRCKVVDMSSKSMVTPTRRNSIPLFQNPWLEKLTHVHPIIPLLIWGPVAIALMWHSLSVHPFGILRFLFLGLSGLITWTLTEYILHRFAFHYVPKRNWEKRIVFMMHGIHHDDPDDSTRLVMPPIAAIIFAVILWNLFSFILGRSLVEPFFAFFLVGYLCYDYIHFSIHFFKPRTSLGRYLKHHHMQHHFITHGARWGVSTPLWDWVFGTLPQTKTRAAHATYQTTQQ